MTVILWIKLPYALCSLRKTSFHFSLFLTFCKYCPVHVLISFYVYVYKIQNSYCTHWLYLFSYLNQIFVETLQPELDIFEEFEKWWWFFCFIWRRTRLSMFEHVSWFVCTNLFEQIPEFLSLSIKDYSSNSTSIQHFNKLSINHLKEIALRICKISSHIASFLPLFPSSYLINQCITLP